MCHSIFTCHSLCELVDFFFFIELLRNEVFVFLIYGNINRIEYSVFHAFSSFFFLLGDIKKIYDKKGCQKFRK